MNNKRLLYIVLGCVLAVLLAGGGFAAVSGAGESTGSVLLVEPEGGRETLVEYGSAYQEPGAAARYGDNAISEVTVSGQVDAQTLGSYLVKYTATYKGAVGTAYRRVRVVDTCLPEITLVSDPEKFTLPSQTYQEEGYSAKDNHDGDLTDRVIRSETREKVTYTVTDSSGNTTTVERTIAYLDPDPPVISLKGQQTVILRVGQAYREPGYTAQDECDGDVTSKVVVSGGVNYSQAGKYTLTYKVQDAFGNAGSTTRTIFVLGKVENPEGEENTDGPGEMVTPNGKVIYLTFDDGPGPYTERLLDILREYNVKATFFVVNTGRVDVLEKIAADGHAIGIHTATHVFKEVYASEEAYFADLYKMQGVIREKTGIETTLLRFPGGSSNTISKFNKGIMTRLTKQVTEKGFRYFDWNVDSKDAGGAKDAETVFMNVVQGIGNKEYSVVLQHDIKSFSVDAVEMIIIWGLENGYTFLPLDPTSPECHHSVNN